MYLLSKACVSVSHWEMRYWKWKSVAWFALSSNSFSKQIFLEIYNRQSQCHVVFPYLLVTMDGASCRYHVLCLLFLLPCFCFLPLLFFSILCVCSSFRIKIENIQALRSCMAITGQGQIRSSCKSFMLGLSSVGKEQCEGEK